MNKIKTEIPTNETLLIEKLEELSSQRPHHFYSKLATKYKDENNNLNFKTSVTITSDSAIGALIAYANIPVFSVLVNKDSVTLLNRRQKCYSFHEISFFKEKFNLNLSLKNVEELLYGMPIAWDKEQSYYQIENDTKKSIASSEREDNLQFRYYFNDEVNIVEKIVIHDVKENTSVEIRYLERQLVGDYLLPKESEIIIQTNNGQINVNIKYNQVTINQPRALSLSIPEKYEVCE